jgi:hypothetical protein
MEGDPTAGSTTIYAGDCAGHFNFQQRLRPLHSGGVSTYTVGKGKRVVFRGPLLNILISGIEETANGTVSGTWLYEWSFFMETSTSAAALSATTASQAAADA